MATSAPATIRTGRSCPQWSRWRRYSAGCRHSEHQRRRLRRTEPDHDHVEGRDRPVRRASDHPKQTSGEAAHGHLPPRHCNPVACWSSHTACDPPGGERSAVRQWNPGRRCRVEAAGEVAMAPTAAAHGRLQPRISQAGAYSGGRPVRVRIQRKAVRSASLAALSGSPSLNPGGAL